MRALVAVLLVAIALVPMAASANHSVALKWPGSSVQRTVYLASTDPETRSAVETAVDNWNLSPVVDLTIEDVAGDCRIRSGAITACDSGCDGMSTTLYGIKGGKQISYALVMLRQSCAIGETYNYDLFRACHELGHALGLGHRELESGSCMALNVSTTPDAHDYEMLETIY